MCESERVVVAAVQSTNRLGFALRDFKARDQRVEYQGRKLVQRPVEIQRKGLEAWKDRFREPDVILYVIILTPNLVGFLTAVAVRDEAKPCHVNKSRRQAYLVVLDRL